MSKRLVALLLAMPLGGGALVTTKQIAAHPRGQDTADVLKRAGYQEDDKGRIILDPNAPISLAYDPNLRDPTTGLRASVNRIDSCFEAASHLESCINSAPRCVSATPWKDDPAGDDCCPESCVREYHELRKTRTEGAAFMTVFRGTCYPGLKALLSGRKP